VGLVYIPGPTKLKPADRVRSHCFSENGGPVVKFRAWNRVAVAFVLGILVLSSLTLLFAFAPTASHPSTAGSGSGGLRADSSLGHGDLTVLAGQTVVLSPGTTGSAIYYEAGNFSVQAGGTLIIEKLTIDWVQFIGTTGNVAQRLGNVFWFADAGTVTMSQSTITTDPNVLNAFVKLNVSVTGKMVVGSDSTFEFPGWVTVSAGGSLFFNDSTSTNNPGVGSQLISPTLLGDEEFSPALQATTGGQIFIGDSTVENYYADDYGANGIPGAYLSASNETSNSPWAWGGFTLQAPVAQGIAQAYAWENNPLASGFLQIGYITTANYNAATGSTFTYGGTPYQLGPINFGTAAAGALLDVPLPAAAITAIQTSGGAPAFLQNSGEFGPSTEAVNFNFDVSNVNVTSLEVQLVPQIQYNMTADGTGSQITAVDSLVGINFDPVPGTPIPLGGTPPVPWESNKLLLTNGANAYLGNITVSGAPFAPFTDSSAVIPNGTSQAYFYQWLEVPITGGRNGIPVANGTTAATYAGSSATLATTVAGLNDLGVTDPILATYVSQALAAHGLVESVSGGQGMAWSLLLSTIVDSSLLPTGQFVGTYNVTVTVPPGNPGEITYVAASLTPYPQVVSPGAPFTSPSAAFPNYEAILAITSSSSLVASVANSTVAIGQTLQVNVVVTNNGTAPTNNYTVELTYPAVPKNIVVASSGLVTAPISAGDSVTVPVSWLVNESVTGLRDLSHFLVTFGVTVVWNGGLPDGGTNSTSLLVTITPAFISISYTQTPGKLPTNGTMIVSTGVATYAGKGTGMLTVYALGKGGTYVLQSGPITSGASFETDLAAVTGMSAGSTYTIELSASYNGRTYTEVVGTMTVAGTAPTPSIFSFLTMKVLFFPIWIWLAIAAGIIVAVAGVMLGLGRFARGRLVECGECGNLIPEDATVCPKCGAEFETDLVRCSRCGSTIPASSAVCPECAATLLARAGPENADPERQGYADFVERFRTEAKKELGANYSEGAFWDWWKRQPTYVSFSQWRLQQAQGTRSGMTAPMMTEPAAAPATAPGRRPPTGGAPPTMAAAAPAPAARPAPPIARTAPPAAAAPAATPTPSPAAAPAAAAAPAVGMKNCPNCGKQINADFLVCPFCGSVTG
jgi:RNA polymerase subunit RPABC4/transcription elongation factor Spt4